MQIIKQGISHPFPVVKQVAIIYAGTNGYLDDIPVNRIREFEQGLCDDLDSLYVGFVQIFNKEKTLTPEVKKALDKILTEFKEKFLR